MKYLFCSLGLATVAAAHGFVQNATIGGKEYDFYDPYQDPYKNPKPDRISRPIAGNGPVEDFSLADIQCGGAKAYGQDGSAPAALHADATAGSEVELRWTLWPDSHVGPVITYMAQCPDTGCNDWLPGDKAVWFKVQEGGREGTSNTWAASALMKAGGVATYTIPECIKPGYYLVRHEIIALHAAYKYPGAQAYPGCHQLKVSGSGTTTPSTGLVSFPGAYKEDTPGIVYDPYKAQEYTIPGPSVFSCSENSGSVPKPSNAAPANTLATRASTVPTPVKEDVVSIPTATPTPGSGSGSAGEYNLESFITYLKSRNDAPEEFTLQSFVAWLEEKPQSGSEPAPAPAPTSAPIKESNNGNAGGYPARPRPTRAPAPAPVPVKESNDGNGRSCRTRPRPAPRPVKEGNNGNAGSYPARPRPAPVGNNGNENGGQNNGNGNGGQNNGGQSNNAGQNQGNDNGYPAKPIPIVAAPAPSGTTAPVEKEYDLESFIAWLQEQEV